MSRQQAGGGAAVQSGPPQRRRLNSFRRQLAAAFGSERQARLNSASVELGATSSNVGAATASKWRRSCEVGEQFGHPSKQRPAQGGGGGGQQSAGKSKRHFRSPNHLIRMFAAERRDCDDDDDDEDDNDDATRSSSAAARRHGDELLGDRTNFISFIIETPTQAANCLAIVRRPNGAATSNSNACVQHDERRPQRRDILSGGGHLSGVQADNPATPATPASIRPSGQREEEKCASPVKPAALARKRLSKEASRLVEFLEARQWADNKLAELTNELTGNNLYRLRRAHLAARAALGEQPLNADEESLRLQQEAVWELVNTELHYLGRLNLIVGLFLDTLSHVQLNLGLLTTISGQQLVSNASHVLQANLNLWTRHLACCCENDEDGDAGQNSNERPEIAPRGRLVKPGVFGEAFASMHHAFKPYYRYCIEQPACAQLIRRLAATSDCFRAYLDWCEQRPECERMKLTDLLACPMQRLTRYPLLLRNILKRTPTNTSEHEQLARMVAFSDRFVKSVDLELRRRDEFVSLIRAASSLDLNDPGEALGGDSGQQQQIADLLSRHYRRPDLTAPLFNCPLACPRQLLFSSTLDDNDAAAAAAAAQVNRLGPLKFKDGQTPSKLDVELLVLTDQLIVCKRHHQASSERHLAGASALKRQNSSYLASFKRRSMRLSKRRTATAATGSSSNLQALSPDKCPASPANPAADDSAFCNEPHSDSNFSAASLAAAAAVEGAREWPKRLGDSPTSSARMEPNGSDNLASWPRRRRAVSHSYVFGTNLLALAHQSAELGGRPPAAESRGDGEAFRSACAQLGADMLLCKAPPARTILQVPPSGRLEARHRLLSRSSQQLTMPAAGQQQAARRPLNQASLSSRDNSSDCSLVSNQNEQPAWPGGRGGQLGDQYACVAAALQQHRKQAERGAGASSSPATTATRRLRAIRPPYPIERLAMHELADGLSVLFCQLNETRTIVNSFVIYCQKAGGANSNLGATNSASGLPAARANKQVGGEAQQRQAARTSPNHSLSSGAENNSTSQPQRQATKTAKRTGSTESFSYFKRMTGANYHEQEQPAGGLSRARRLMLLVKEAQVLHRTVAKLHGVRLPASATEAPPAAAARRGSSTQNSLSLEVPPAAGYSRFRSNDSGDLAADGEGSPPGAESSWRLRIVAEAHQLFLLNHGLHHELATNEYSYSLRGAADFLISTRPIAPTPTHKQQHAAAAGGHQRQFVAAQRPHLGRLSRVASDCRSDTSLIVVSIDSPKSPPQELAALVRDKSKSNGCLSERAARHHSDAQPTTAPNREALHLNLSSRSPPPPPLSMAANWSQASSPLTNNSAQSSPQWRSRRNLSALRRQNVILSASCEQHQQLQPTNLHIRPEPVRGRRRLHKNRLESSSVESLDVTSTEESCARHRSFRSAEFRRKQQESSSIQTSTIDQTFDEEERQAGGPQLVAHIELSPIKSIQSQPSTPLPHQNSARSASTEQTSAPIAFTLAVPSRPSISLTPDVDNLQQQQRQHQETGGNVAAMVSCFGLEDGKRPTGCLDLNKTLRLVTGGGGKWRDPGGPGGRVKRAPEKARRRSRSLGSRLQLMIECLRPNR